MTSDIEAAQQSLTGPPNTEESVLSTGYSNDIQAQHSNLVDSLEGPSSQATHPPTWDSDNAVDSIEENKTRIGQMTPGDHASVESDDVVCFVPCVHSCVLLYN